MIPDVDRRCLYVPLVPGNVKHYESEPDVDISGMVFC